MKIVVTGSLGNIGKPLTQTLVQSGHEVTVITSSPDRQKDIEALGAKAAIGSVEDIDFLTATFTGADVVHTMIPPNSGAPDPIVYSQTVGSNYAKAIQQSGVKRVVHISSYGAELEKGAGLIVLQRHVEEMLNQLPLESLTFLRATYIYYNLYRFVDMIKNAGFIASNYGGDDRVVLVSPVDIAAAAVNEIENQTPGKHVRYVASDERTCNEIATALGEAIGKPDLKWNLVSDAEMQSAYEGFGIPKHVAGLFVEMFAACHTGLLNEDYDKHMPKLGKVKLEDFAKEFAAVYNAK
jgi:uncharacterized protein YbjT (DUF2867 family)